jgi:calcium/calmodulin-dependent protein kinase I
VAPEILNGYPYDERADNWSLGVIAYILLGGYSPFRESDLRKLFRTIRKGDYEFHDEYWSAVSRDAKDFIESLLTVDHEQRATAKDALNHKWIAGDGFSLSRRNLGANLEQFKKFNARRKFKSAVGVVSR